MREEINILWKWLAIKEKSEKADVIFLFGGSTITIAQKGLELFQEGFAEYIIVTGNTGTFGNPEWRKPCADIFADFLFKNDITKNNVIIQNKSMNTLEDIQFSIPLLEQKRIPHTSLIIVSRPVHQRRAFATFKKQYPAIKLINSPCEEISPLEANEEELEEIKTRCLQEYDRIIKYGEKRDLEKQSIPDDIRNVAKNLQKM